MRYAKRRLAVKYNGLRRYTAGPEHGDFVRRNRYWVAIIRLGYVAYTDQSRISKVDWCAMHLRQLRCDLYGTYYIVCAHWAHCYNHRT